MNKSQDSINAQEKKKHEISNEDRLQTYPDRYDVHFSLEFNKRKSFSFNSLLDWELYDHSQALDQNEKFYRIFFFVVKDEFSVHRN